MTNDDRQPRGPKQVKVTIDSEIFSVPKAEISAHELRALPDPDIGPDRDLYLEAPGNQDDDLIENDGVITLKDKMRFFTAPASITPGHVAAC
jgi:hypothetical protein